MPKPQQVLDLERVMRSIDTRAAVVILIGDHDELETATKGIDNDAALFSVLWSMTVQLAQELFDELPAEQQRQARLVLPTAEDAKRLGILGRSSS